jgi:hypothetical protein
MTTAATAAPAPQPRRILIERAATKAADPDLHGRPVFTLRLELEDGSASEVWRGDSYAAARLAAAVWAASGLPISDRTGEL